MDIRIILGVVVAIILVSVIVYMLVIKLKAKKKEEPKNYIERQNSGSPYQILNDDIEIPKDGYNYGMSFFIYINDYTYNSGVWKHVLHKGNELNTGYPMNYSQWDNLTSVIDVQSPGIWMHPNGTKMRICFTVKISKNHCLLNLTEEECGDTHCNWDGMECVNSDKHALKMYDSKNLEYTRDDMIIEYLDIEIPYKKMCHIGITLENQVLMVYFNGKLSRTHKFFGEPILNTDNMFFNYPNTYDGTIFNYSYFPITLTPEKIDKLSKQRLLKL
tara:strand:+ start:2041 stop:2859 length:819 start_codon:yes stop_codon:yes gene_type:complete